MTNLLARRLSLFALFFVVPLPMLACGDDGGGSTVPEDVGLEDSGDDAEDTDLDTEDVGDTDPEDTDGTNDTEPQPSCDPDATPFGGTTTIEGETYDLLCSEVHLDNVRTDPIGNFYQVADITLTSEWTPIPEFQGRLLGDGESVIYDLTIDSEDDSLDTGFIGWLTNGGSLENLFFDNASVAGYRMGFVVSSVVETARDDLGKPATSGATLRNVHVNGTMEHRGGNSGGIARVLGAGAVVENVSVSGSVSPGGLLEFMADLGGANANFGCISWRAQGGAELRDVACHADLAFGLNYARVAGIVMEAKDVDGTATIDGAVFDGSITAESVAGGLCAVCRATVSNVRIGGTIESVDSGQVTGVGYTLDGAYSYVVVDVALDANDDPVAITGNASFTAIAYAADIGNGSSRDGNPEVYGVSRGDMTDADFLLWDAFDDTVWTFADGETPRLAFEADLPRWD